MSKIMSPQAPQQEAEGMLLAEQLLTSPCRVGWTRKQVVSFSEQATKRYRAMGKGDKANGFEYMALTIAKTRSI